MNPLREVPKLHQLPPKWDGRDVDWRGWEVIRTSAEYGGRRHGQQEACEGCGSLGKHASNIGVLHPLTGETQLQPVFKRTKPKGNGRPGTLYQAGEQEVPVKATVQLFAFRCPDCGLDTVWDMRTDEWWLLEESDYGADGSTDPRLF